MTLILYEIGCDAHIVNKIDFSSIQAKWLTQVHFKNLTRKVIHVLASERSLLDLGQTMESNKKIVELFILHTKNTV